MERRTYESVVIHLLFACPPMLRVCTRLVELPARARNIRLRQVTSICPWGRRTRHRGSIRF